MVEINRVQQEASWCWRYSTKVLTEQHPYRDNDFGLTKNDLLERCEELLLIPDPSVRVMVLKALFLMHARTVHVGFIATLITSDEYGMDFDSQGTALGKSSVSRCAMQYFYDILNLKEMHMCTILQEKNAHWLGCLESGKYNIPKMKLDRRKTRVAMRRMQTRMWARNDISEYLRLMIKTDYCDRRTREVYEDIETIIRHVCTEDVPISTVTAVLVFLARLASSGYFSESELVKIVQEVVVHTSLSDTLQNLMLSLQEDS